MNDTASKPAARDRILTTAHDLFYGEGVRATGIDRVIADAGVTKATFYRHFPSKNDLVEAFLHYRHERWMAWFDDALNRHRSDGAMAVVHALREWFSQSTFRGCAFINTVVELGGSVPAFEDISRDHKQDMTASIRGLLPEGESADVDASAIALAVDGAIIRAQYTHDPEAALLPLSRLIRALTSR